MENRVVSSTEQIEMHETDSDILDGMRILCAEDMQHSLAAGMNAHISKPVDMKLLKKTIRNIKLGGRSPIY